MKFFKLIIGIYWNLTFINLYSLYIMIVMIIISKINTRSFFADHKFLTSWVDQKPWVSGFCVITTAWRCRQYKAHGYWQGIRISQRRFKKVSDGEIFHFQCLTLGQDKIFDQISIKVQKYSGTQISVTWWSSWHGSSNVNQLL